MTATDPARRQALLAAKLGALVRDRWGDDGARQPGGLLRGATLWDAATRTGWVLADAPAARALGPALAWGLKAGADHLHVLVDDPDDGGVLARRATAFAEPPDVWVVVGRDVEPAEPSPPLVEPPLPPDVAAFTGDLRAAGAEVVVEHGVLKGEVLGLEVARVTTDPQTGEPRLEVGVGRHDREGRSMLPGAWSVPALAEVVEVVRGHRRAEAEPHPLNRLATERWLRAVVVEDPSIAGAARLEPIASPVARDDLRQVAPAPAAGVDPDDHPVVVVCSTGVDVDLVPAAADARLTDGRPGCRLRLVLPEPDALPVTRRLAAALTDPAEVVTVPTDWRRL